MQATMTLEETKQKIREKLAAEIQTVEFVDRLDESRDRHTNGEVTVELIEARLAGHTIMTEPDRIAWVDETTGLPCIARRGPTSVWCGYVGAPASTYEIEGLDDEHDFFPDFDVHGGTTYGPQPCDDDEGFGVCHVSADDDSDDPIRWVGFDCGHFRDSTPYMDAMTDHLRENDPRWVDMPKTELDQSYRDVFFAIDEIRSLAAQISARRIVAGLS